MKLSGGYGLDRSRANPEDRFHDEVHPHDNGMHKHDHEHRIVDPKKKGLLGPYKNQESHWVLDPHEHNHDEEQHSHNASNQSRTVVNSTKKLNDYYHNHEHFDNKSKKNHTGRHLHTKKPELDLSLHQNQKHFHKYHRDDNNNPIGHNNTTTEEPSNIIDNITDTVSNLLGLNTDQTEQSRTVQNDRSTDNCKKQENPVDCGSNPGCKWDENETPQCSAKWGTSEKSGKKTFQGPMLGVNSNSAVEQEDTPKIDEIFTSTTQPTVQTAAQPTEQKEVSSTQSRINRDNVFRGKDVPCTDYHGQADKCGSIPNCQYTVDKKCKARKNVRQGKKEYQGPLLGVNPNNTTVEEDVPNLLEEFSAPARVTNTTQSRIAQNRTTQNNNTTEPKFTKTDINKMTVPKIRNELKKRGLDMFGSRQELIDRLNAALF